MRNPKPRRYWNPAKGMGETLAWLKERVTYQGDDCIQWPFSRGWNGYGHVSVEGKLRYAHRHMCELVNGPPPTPKHVAAHTCNNGHDGCITPKHLAWKTPRENLIDRRAAGTLTKKRWNNRGSLTAEQMAQIRDLKGKKNQREIGEMFGISYQHVSMVQNGRLIYQQRGGHSR